LPTYRIVLPVVVVTGLTIFCVVRNIPRFRAMLLGIVVFSAYGILQDQVSARLCPEYFTAFHPPIPGLTDPTLMGITWGCLGSWWGGALVGYIAGTIATSGTKHPPLPVRSLVLPMLVTALAVAVVPTLAGVSVWRHVELFDVKFDTWVSHVVPPERQRNAFVVASYHLVAYGASVMSGVVMCVWVGFRRAGRA
jgi:hypothetical protein